MNEPSKQVGYCPKCGRVLEDYSQLEGGWCPHCNEWFPVDIVEERMGEDEDQKEGEEE